MDKNKLELDTSQLDSNKTDKNVFLLKESIKAIIPSALGEVFSEIIGSIIPNQQEERVINFIKKLAQIVESNNERINNIEGWINQIKANKFNILLFEQSVRFSAQTESDIKHHCYAYFIYNTINDKNNENFQKEKILRTISILNELEILHLIGIGQTEILFQQSDFRKKFGKYIDVHSATSDNLEDKKFNAMLEAYLNELIVQGLAIAKGELKRGDSSLYLSEYGRIVYDAILDENYFCK